MSTATHTGAKDGLHALALLVTYPARLWLASRTSPPPRRQPAAIHYLSVDEWERAARRDSSGAASEQLLLSPGRQRAAAQQAPTLTDPALLLADEPIRSLDPDTGRPGERRVSP
jgi:hypothetical protein